MFCQNISKHLLILKLYSNLLIFNEFWKYNIYLGVIKVLKYKIPCHNFAKHLKS